MNRAMSIKQGRSYGKAHIVRQGNIGMHLINNIFTPGEPIRVSSSYSYKANITVTLMINNKSDRIKSISMRRGLIPTYFRYIMDRVWKIARM
ncbi:unnamed protein product, partial [Dovyalis caffra]